MVPPQAHLDQGVSECGLLCLLKGLEVKVRPNALLVFTELCSLQAGLLQVLGDAVPMLVLGDLGQRGWGCKWSRGRSSMLDCCVATLQVP